ncbi:MAG: DUF5666 domain-containing protein, partial [Candidatus Methylomirabilia bacterium]
TEIEDKLVKRFKSKGIISNFAGPCPSATFDLNGFPVTTGSNTRYKDGSCATLANGVEVEARGVTMPDGTNQATNVKVKGAGVQPVGNFEVTGIISGLAGTCPDTTFDLDNNAGFVVTTDTTTQYTGGTNLSCADLHDGVKVDVTGVTQKGTNLATEVEIKGAPAPANFTVKGTISSLAGNCPDRTFEVAGSVVTTDMKTQYTSGTNLGCADLDDGVKVEVTGVTQPDGTTNLATEVSFVI